MKHLYVHIPFCRSRCSYCDFASEPVGPHARSGRIERYLETLRAELADRAGASAAGEFGASDAPGASAATMPGAATAGAATAGPANAAPDAAVASRGVAGLVAEPSPDQRSSRFFETIYLGGGTPTALPADDLVALVRDLALWLKGSGAPGSEAQPAAAPQDVGPAPEFTIEANPGTVNAPLLERLREAGVTRLSLGVQSFSPALRAALGRRVAQKEIADALAAVAAAGWQEWNLDLVFGIPGQTWSEAAADLDAAIGAGPSHISLYDLTYTPKYEAWLEATQAAGARRAAGAFVERHFADAVAKLEAAGYRRYEVSNFALPGHECLHNLAYWRGEDYLGIGASAVSTIAGERRTNPRLVVDYLAGRPVEIEALSQATRQWEKAMLGLRTSEGVEEAAVLPALDQAARNRLLAQGCLERHCGRLRLNPGFLDISNAVIGALLVHPGES